MILPCELIGFRGDDETREFREVYEASSIRWNVTFEYVKKPHKRLLLEWEKFLCWLKNQEIATLIDFDDKIKTKYEVTGDKNCVKINNDESEYCKATKRKYGQAICEKIDHADAQGDFRMTIAEMKPNKSLVIHCMFPPRINASNINAEFPFNNQINRCIEQSKAIAAADASAKDHCMGGWWILTSKDKLFKLENGLFSRNWKDNSSGCAEVIVLLELMTVLEKRGRYIVEGQVAIGFDCKKAHKKMINEVLKCNEHAKEAGSEIAMIKRSLDKIKFNAVLKLMRGHEDSTERYQLQPLKHLIRECDIKSKEERINAINRERDANLKYFRSHAIMKENAVLSRSI